MYDTKNFSIPNERCFEEKHEWGVTRPIVLVLVKEGNSFLYLDKDVAIEFPQTELALGETLNEATARVLAQHGYPPGARQDNFVGYFSVGRRRIPHFLVIHFAEKNTNRSTRGMVRMDPVTEVVNHRVFGVISQSLLSLVAQMGPDDCLGWGDHGLIVWPCERKVRQSTRRLAAERLAA